MLKVKRRKVQLITQNIGIQIARYQANLSSTIWRAYSRQNVCKSKGYIENFKDYFSDYDESYAHPRKYFWDISSTLNQEFTKKFINYSIKKQTENKSRKNNRNIWRDNELNK